MQDWEREFRWGGEGSTGGKEVDWSLPLFSFTLLLWLWFAGGAGRDWALLLWRSAAFSTCDSSVTSTCSSTSSFALSLAAAVELLVEGLLDLLAVCGLAEEEEEEEDFRFGILLLLLCPFWL